VASHTETSSNSGTTRWWQLKVTDTAVLFPLLAVTLLAVIAYGTYSLIMSAYDSARQLAASSTIDLGQTYEAQVVRALREIDQSLKFIQYAYEAGETESVLADLGERGLLPTDLLFVVSITDESGSVVDSTQPFEGISVAGREFFETHRDSETLTISKPRQYSETGEWSLEFGRRLNSADGNFAGIAIVSVDPMYFVSSYEPHVMGDNGILAILGTDGVFRARRSGDHVQYGDTANYAALLAAGQHPASGASVWTNDWDGVRRYTVVHELFGFPLAIVVGLSEQEQLVNAAERRDLYLLQAAGGSILALIVLLILGRLNLQLHRSRMLAIEEQVAHAAQVEYLAYHDNLTGLPNRSFFSKLLSRSVNEAQRYDRQLSVLFLDLDGFKSINDTLGHAAGDDLLKEVGQRLKTSLRESDTVARLGGDEFVVLLPQMADEASLSATATKILETIRKPFTLVGQEFRISTSIGISRFPQDGQDEETLMKNADVAMYSAKEQGKNNFRLYSSELNANTLERLTLESNLRRALERGEYQIYYQVRKNVRSKVVTGVEALLRWRHPELGVVPPKQFLPLAEETGLIVPIGRWVLETVCRQSVAWKAEGLASISMAVNLSAREFFDPHFLSSLAEILRKTGIDAGVLEIEVTESVLLRDLEKTLTIIDGIKTLGVRVAIDNFGAGYSSLATLKQFRLDTIKVDGTFIRSIEENLDNNSLIEGIIKIAKVLGLTVVAEGVETKTQADYLDAKSCDEVQGFYFSAPVPASRIADLMKSRSSVTPFTRRPSGSIGRH
jgi:diguanylate cyclase (GGDEF)-like protein